MNPRAQKQPIAPQASDPLSAPVLDPFSAPAQAALVQAFAPLVRVVVEVMRAEVRDALRAELAAARPTLAEPPGRELIRVNPDAARRAGCSPRTLQRDISRGKLRAVRRMSTGSARLYVERAELERYLAELARPA